MLSLLIPVLNEEKVLPEFFARVGRLRPILGDHEIIFIDDGSTDRTAALIEEQILLWHSPGRIRLISFSRNFGHQMALAAGLEHATGDAAVILDADLQDPPELIEQFLEKWREGFLIVYGVRKKRKESLFKKAAYALFYRLLHSIADISIPLDAGDFCLMDRQVVDAINAFPERGRFLRGLRAWSGFPSVGIEYERPERFAGETKYSIGKLTRLAMDGIIGFSTTPLKISTYLGFGISACSILAMCVLLYIKLATNASPQGWTSVMVAVFFLAGVQLFILGIMGEYISRITIEVQRRPRYIVRTRRGFPDAHG